MKNILRALLFGVMAGIGLGIYFSERGRQRQEQEAHDAFVNDPEMMELTATARRLRQADRWMDDIEKETGSE